MVEAPVLWPVRRGKPIFSRICRAVVVVIFDVISARKKRSLLYNLASTGSARKKSCLIFNKARIEA
jgi:hypothetical protein